MSLKVKVKSLSRVRLFAIPWTAAYQASQSMGFSRQDAGVGCHFLLQGIFPIQGSNPGLPHCRQTLYPLSQQGSPKTMYIPQIKNILLLKNGKCHLSLQQISPPLLPRPTGEGSSLHADGC